MCARAGVTLEDGIDSMLRAFRVSRFSLVVILLFVAGCTEETVSEDPFPQMDQWSSPIVGGNEVNSGWESVVFLYAGGGVCTGTLVSDDVVLTASHCLDGVWGSIDVYWCTDCIDDGYWSLRTSNDYHQHPHYNPNTMVADIAVLVLTQDGSSTPINMNKDEPSNSWLGNSNPLHFVGFGVTAYWANDSGVKREVDIAVDEWDGTTLYYYSTNQQTCFGDSGGPAFTDHSGQWKVAGVTSYGDENCSQYGADTRVDTYASWVEGYTGTQPDDDDDTGDDDTGDDDTGDDDTGDDDTGDDDVGDDDVGDDDTTFPQGDLPEPPTSGRYDMPDGLNCIGDVAGSRRGPAALAAFALVLLALRRRR